MLYVWGCPHDSGGCAEEMAMTPSAVLYFCHICVCCFEVRVLVEAINLWCIDFRRLDRGGMVCREIWRIPTILRVRQVDACITLGYFMGGSLLSACNQQGCRLTGESSYVNRHFEFLYESGGSR